MQSVTPLKWVWKGLRIFTIAPRLSQNLQNLPLIPPEQLAGRSAAPI